MIPHRREKYEYILSRYNEIVELVHENDRKQ